MRTIKLAAVAVAALALLGCSTITTTETKRNLHEWQAVEQAVQSGELSAENEDVHASWAARITAARHLAENMHTAAAGDEDNE